MCDNNSTYAFGARYAPSKYLLPLSVALFLSKGGMGFNYRGFEQKGVVGRGIWGRA